MNELQRRRLLVAGVAAWAVLLLVLGFFGTDATVREHRDVAAARTAVDKATVDVVRAAGRDAVVRVSRYQRVGECKVSVIRSGAEYRRRIELHVTPGGERDLLARIADRLPDDYRAYHNAGRLFADAPEFITVRGGTREGLLWVDLLTECRPFDEPVTTWRTAPTKAERDHIETVRELFGVTDRSARWHSETVVCGDQAIREVSLTVADVPDRPLEDSARLMAPDARVLVSTERLLAFREGGVSVVVEVRDGMLRITRTAVTC